MEKAIESDITNRNVAEHHHEHEITIPDVPTGETHDEASSATGEDGDHNHHEKTN